MSLHKLANMHRLQVLKPIVTSGSGLGIKRAYVNERVLTCTINPKDPLEVFDVQAQRTPLIPHKVYFDKDPELTLDRRLRWLGVGRDTVMRIAAVPFNVGAQSRLWTMRANSRGSDNIGPDKVAQPMQLVQGKVPEGYIQVWLESGDGGEDGPGTMTQRWLSPEEYQELLSDAGRVGISAPPEPIQEPREEIVQDGIETFITLDMAAATVQRSKNTLRKYMGRKRDPLPDPDIQGMGGKPSEWRWDSIRPWLEHEFGRKLPENYPGSRLTREPAQAGPS